MTQKERNRMVVLIAVTKNELKLVQGAELMAVSYRQAKRLHRRFQAQGEAGLVHRSRGRPSSRRKTARLRRRVLARYQQRYAGFGSTLAAEHRPPLRSGLPPFLNSSAAKKVRSHP